MKILLLLFLPLQLFAQCGISIPNPHQNLWRLPGCVAWWDGTYGVVGNFTNLDLSTKNTAMFATSHQPSQSSVGVPNGQPIIRYTNNSMWISNSFFLLTNDNAIYVVAKCYGSESTNINIFLANASSTNRQAFKIGTSATPTLQDTATVTGTTLWTGITTSWFCGVFINTGGVVTFRTNGASAGGATGTITNIAVNCIGNVLIPTNVFMTCDFGCEAIFSPHPPTGIQTRIEAKLGDRFKLPYR